MMRQQTSSPSPRKRCLGTISWALAGCIGLCLPLTAEETSPAEDEEEGPVIEIDADSAPIIDDRANVTVRISEDGSISATDEAAIRGEGTNWTVENAGLLEQTGDARATLHLQEGTFENRAAAESEEDGDEPSPGRISWNSGSDLQLTEAGDERRFSSVFIESWTRDATNAGEVRLIGTHDLSLNTDGASFDFTAIHLGGRRKETEEGSEPGEEPSPLTFTNRGEVSAVWSGNIQGSGTGNEVRITGVRLEELEFLDNHGVIEAVFEGELQDAGGNQISATGVRTDADGDVLNFADGVIRAEINAGGDADGARLAATGIRSEGELIVENRGTIKAIVRGDITGEPAATEATGIHGLDGAWIQNTHEILVSNELGGSATGIRIRLEQEDPPPEPADEDEDPAEPRRSEVRNSGTLSVRASEGGNATGIWSDGNLTLTNNGLIEVTGTELPVPEAANDDNSNGDEENDEPPAPTTPFQHGTGVLVENGDGDLTNQSDGVIRVTGEADSLDGVVFNEGGIVRNQGTIEVINEQDGGAATGITIRRDTSLEDDTGAGRAEIVNSGTIQVNPGSLAVNLENGGSLVNSGTIIGDVFLGDGDATLTITPDHEIDGTVDVGTGHNILELGSDGARTGEYAGEFDGFTELNVRANNTLWRLSGDQAYADGTEIFTGILFSGDTLTSDLRIHMDGSFVGTGTVAGDITTSGLVAVGDLDDDRNLLAPDGGATLRVEGDIAFEEGSVLYIVPGETNLHSTGTVTIDAGDDETESPAPRLHLRDDELDWGDQFVVLEADGEIFGEFGSVTSDGFRPFLRADLAYGQNDVTATTVADEDALLGAAQTQNQRSIAQVLANLEPSSAIEEGYRQFFRDANFMNFGQIADSMSGEVIATGALAAPSISQGYRQTIFNTIHHRPASTTLRYSAPPGSPPPPEPRSADHAIWTRVVGLSGDIEGQGGTRDFDYRAMGVLVGFDYLNTPEARAGVAFGYGDTRVSRGADQIDGDFYQASLYGSLKRDILVYDGIVGYGFHDHESRRLIQPVSESASTSYNGHEFFAAVQASMPMDLDGIVVLPLAGLDYSHYRQGDFRESGAWGLEGNSIDLNTLRATLGMRVMMEYITVRNGVVNPEFRFGYSHTLFDRDTSFSATLLEDEQGSRFVTRSGRLNRNEFSIGTGVAVEPGRWENVSIFADYDFSIQRHHLFSTGIRIGF